MSPIHDSRSQSGGEKSTEPISWLVLEAYALGELDAEEAARVEARVADDEESQRCLAMIREQEGRALPPLPALADLAPSQSLSEAPGAPEAPGASGPSRLDALLDWLRDRLGSRRLGWAAAAVAFACLALLLYSRGGQETGLGSEWPGPRAVIKGDDIIAIGLVRERNGSITHDPASFAASDRFQALVTCPPYFALRGELVVYQDGEASFPRPPISEFACGNRVVVPGAFRLIGDAPATICLVYSDVLAASGDAIEPPDRAALTSSPGAQPAVCVTLQTE